MAEAGDSRLARDVVLPSDPVWKRDYAGSVQRLVRDGIDVPLAKLFVHAARDVPPGCRRGGSSAQRHRVVPLPAAGDPGGHQGAFHREHLAPARFLRKLRLWRV